VPFWLVDRVMPQQQTNPRKHAESGPIRAWLVARWATLELYRARVPCNVSAAMVIWRANYLTSLTKFSVSGHHVGGGHDRAFARTRWCPDLSVLCE
jgi:hypothetical protein